MNNQREQSNTSRPFSGRPGKIVAAALLAVCAGLLGAHYLQQLSAGEKGHHKKEPVREAGKAEQLIPTGQKAVPQTVKNGTRTLQYLLLQDSVGKPTGFILNNEELNTKIKGYHGPVTLAVRTDLAGVAQDLVVLKHSDTPRYMEKVLAQKAKFLKKSIVPATKPAADVVSGATYSSAAISESLYEIGTAFRSVLQPAKPATGAAGA